MELPKLRISIITSSPFPYGDASTLRFSAYCISFAQKNIFTKVHILSGSNNINAMENKSVGIYKGVYFKCFNKNVYETNKLNVFLRSIKYLRAIKDSLMLLRQDKINTVIFYGHNWLNVLIYRCFCSIWKIKMIVDKTELPYGYTKMNRFSKYLMKLQLQCFDKYFIITESLSEFYQNYLNKKSLFIYLLPLTINFDLFDSLDFLTTENYIACVFSPHGREFIIDTVFSYKIYSQNVSNPIPLFLYGDFYKLKDFSNIKNFIEKNGLDDLIHIKGLVKSDQIPKILKKSKFMILTGRDYSSTDGFPTKFGEYLATGKPVLSTSAGAIPLYFKNMEDCILASPGNIEDIAQKMIYIHNNYLEVCQIAIKGYSKAKKIFNADTYVEDLINFCY